MANTSTARPTAADITRTESVEKPYWPTEQERAMFMQLVEERNPNAFVLSVWTEAAEAEGHWHMVVGLVDDYYTDDDTEPTCDVCRPWKRCSNPAMRCADSCTCGAFVDGDGTHHAAGCPIEAGTVSMRADELWTGDRIKIGASVVEVVAAAPVVAQRDMRGMWAIIYHDAATDNTETLVEPRHVTFTVLRGNPRLRTVGEHVPGGKTHAVFTNGIGWNVAKCNVYRRLANSRQIDPTQAKPGTLCRKCFPAGTNTETN